ncbi:MAG: MlaD family protein [Burkholderiales bacterium]
MAESPQLADDLPEAVAAPQTRRSLQLVWLIPLVAALVGGWLAVKAILDKGPVVTIAFATAEGLETGKTKIKYKDVDMGLVTGVALAPDTSHVVVTAELVKEARRYLVEDTRFWVVRPRVSGGTVTGIGTLLSGSYIGMDIGTSKEVREKFVGLEIPPIVVTGEPGRTFILRSDSAGSLDVGSPLYFRHLKAGQIVSYELGKDGRGILIKVFVNASYDRFVNDNTRFWHASGVDVTMNSSGLSINTQSAVSMLIGGLAFETPAESADLPPAAANTEYRLFPNRGEALRNPETDVMKLAVVFEESVRGLAPGAEVDFRGVVVGTVTQIRPHVDLAGSNFKIRVKADIFPRRMRSRDTGKVLSNDERRAMIAGMISRGLRAQLRTASLLTGQLYVALDFFPAAARPKPKPAERMDDDDLPQIPAVPSSLVQLQETLAAIAAKVQKFPLGQVGADLQTTLKSATKLIEHIDNDLAPELRTTLAEVRKAVESADQVLKPNSPLAQDARDAMREVARAAAAFRALADYLERHPEALIGGKRADPKEINK